MYVETAKRTLGFSEVKKWLRHAHPMIYIDRVIDYEPNVYLKACTAISGNMDCIAGHFPDKAVFPGTHIIQAFSQCGIILLQLSTGRLQEDEMSVVSSVNARFFKVVVPGDTMLLEIEIERWASNMMIFSGHAHVDSVRVAAIKASIAKIETIQVKDAMW